MNRIYLLLFVLVIKGLSIYAQYPSGGSGRFGGNRQNMNIGHFYGKLLDSKTNKPIDGATIQLRGNKFDTATKQFKQVNLKTLLSEKNGDFSLDGLPLFGNFKLKITAIGYKTLEQTLSFGIKFPQGGGLGNSGQQPSTEGMPNANIQQLLGQADKDLGNLKLEVDNEKLADVVVTSAPKAAFEMGIDRKVFNVDKSIVSSGQTATELMKTIPSLSVDIDGNVTLRNSTPTIFIDGRPTTLTLDQIPSDIIDKVEIITNPSAKFDASGGNAGILNIVLKKNKKNGYNGGIRTGIDTRGKLNGGGDINYRENKINFLATANFNQRKSIAYNTTNKSVGLPKDSSYNSLSIDTATNNGYFGFGRAGFDYFIDNRNTITVAGSFTKGHFNNHDPQHIDSSTILPLYYSNSQRYTHTLVDFQNIGGQLSFKHNFQKNGHNISGDINYNSSTPHNTSYINTNTYDASYMLKYPTLQQKSEGSGYNHFVTLQSDYENQITEDKKIELGVRSAIREFRTDNLQYLYFDAPVSNYKILSLASSRYKFTDIVNAAYATYSLKIKKWSYQLGLRAESSSYKGTLLKSNGNDSSTFKVNYPISFFPSAFITYKLKDNQDLQVNYSRRVNRPSFFQLIPAYNFSDAQNPSVGNPNLHPEFTESFEFSYNNNYQKSANFLATVYYKYTTDLITQYLYKDINRIKNDGSYINYVSYINANYSTAYGVELTNRITLWKWWDLTANINFFNSTLNANIPGQNVDNSLLAWFGKMNNSIKLNKGLTLQVSSEWTSKSLVPKSGSGGNGSGGSGGGGGGRGMGAFGGGAQSYAQGYILPRNFDVDLGLKKEWAFKNGKSLTANLSINDIFRTHTRTHTVYTGFFQDTDRIRDPQVARLNLSYRFGKIDVSLFKRKNTKTDMGGGMDMVNPG